jgi:CNT family concentrative nucleoside transporter
MLKLVSLFGLFTLVGVAWLMSEHRRKFPWRTVAWGMAFQFFLGWFVLETRLGDKIFNGCQALVDRFIGFAGEGNKLVFGPLASEEVLTRGFGPGNAFILVITITGTIILISAVSTLLYHYGILQLVVRGMAWVTTAILPVRLPAGAASRSSKVLKRVSSASRPAAGVATLPPSAVTASRWG